MKMITELNGYKFSEMDNGPIEKFSEISRISGAEGMVLLKNENSLLPLKAGQKISVFGRTQFDYYKSGTGSGGAIVTSYVANFMDGLRTKNVQINEELCEIYKNWIKENPFDKGSGWATEPWYQKEMPLKDSVVKAAREFSDTAVVFIGRLAGEARDLKAVEGGYYLAKCEEELLKSVAECYDKICVVLNIGNIIDFSWIDKYNITSVLIAWQGGMEGGNACADVLCGDIPACGKLADTVAYNYSDYPSANNFDDLNENIYQEDIYVGYRYFETFAKDKVRYPFGFGLTYTSFETDEIKVECDEEYINVSARVKNVGDYDGKQVIQLYYSAPQGKLGKPAIELGAFAKTGLIKPGCSQTVTMSLKISDMASYDDSGATGHRYCEVMEAGEYNIYLGTDVRNVQKIYTCECDELVVVNEYKSALAPVKPFKRLRPSANAESGYTEEYEDTPLREYNLQERMKEDNPQPLEITGDKGIKLIDVAQGKNTLDEFVAQLSVNDLTCLFKGEGMNSPKSTAGTTGILGGVTESLRSFGIPILNVSDGPSGIRMLTGDIATSMPCGTQLACTWNLELIEELYTFEGIELRTHKMDVLLGPGVNIHRNPLNGRNFEYFSEDPYLSGIMTSAMVKSIQKSGADATVKHFFANNHEENRSALNAVLSERAAREIYLKSFEIAVKNGARSIMTSYNPVNGIWCAGNYDLNTEILRNQWGFEGFVMTDWWATINEENQSADKNNLAAMVRAQNDVYMLANDSQTYDDNLEKSARSGALSLGAMQRSAKNLCRFIMNSAAMQRYVEDGYKTVGAIPESLENYKTICTLESPESDKEYIVSSDKYDRTVMRITCRSDALPTAQNGIRIIAGRVPATTVQVNGTEGNTIQKLLVLALKKGENEITFLYENCISIEKIEFFTAENN